MNLPNWITLFRILTVPLLVYYLLNPGLPFNKYIAVAIFVIVAVSDYIDGYLARKLKKETDLGKFLDPLADKILVISALICLVELRVVSSIPVILIVVRDLAVIGIRLTASSFGRVIAADTMGKYKTVLLDISVAMLIIGMPYGALVLWFAAILAVVSGMDYFIKNKRYLYGRVRS